MTDKLKRFAAFATNLRSLKEIFPEHIKEIDKCLFDVGQKLDGCDDPNCTCKMNFETFHGIASEDKRRSNEFNQ